MIKYSKIILSALGALLLAASCVDDKGNYDYEPADTVKPLEISGVEDAVYDMSSLVVIKPEIKKYVSEGRYEQINDADYDFVWYVFSDRSATLSQVDTLARTRDISFAASFPIDVNHTLVFEVKDRSTGIFERATATIRTASDFSRGFFVLKDDGAMTDLDIVNPDGEVVANVISAANGSKMEGKAKKICFIPMYAYLNASGGQSTDKSAHHVLTETDFQTFDAADFSRLRTFDQEYFYPPEVRRPQDICAGWQYYNGMYSNLATIMMNDGKMHAISGWGVHYSEFDYQRSGTDEMEIFPGYIMWAQGWSAYSLMFDQKGGKFYYGEMYTPAVFEIKTSLPASKMIWMQPTYDYATTSIRAAGWALAKANSDGQHNLLKVAFGYGGDPLTRISPIAASRKLIGAEIREPYIGTSETIYFGHGNELWYYQYTNDDESSTEKSIYTFPAGETVTHISHFQDQPQMLVVCTSAAGKWKMYKFTLKSSLPDIDGTVTPEVFTGTGTARYVVYRP